MNDRNTSARRVLSALSIALALAACSGGREAMHGALSDSAAPLNQAHAHNDYAHERPLLDALSHGFMSVEADVYADPLLGVDLFVAHDPQDIQFDRTLRSLYLDPLHDRVEQLGAVHPGQTQPLQLLIDFKTEAESTWATLESQLESYADMLTVYEDGVVRPGAVTVVLSGNRPTATLASKARRLAFIDGRLSDLQTPPEPNLVPLISDNWGNHFSWRGAGVMPEDESEKLDEIMATALAHGYRIRFWATPDTPGPERENLWQRLFDAGVHHLNTDDLAGLEAFLRRQAAEQDGSIAR